MTSGVEGRGRLRAPRLEPIGRNWRWVLMLSVVALLPTETLFNIPFGIMALCGLVMVARRPAQVFRDPGVQLLLVLFLCIWTPMVLSLPDAANLERSGLTVLKFLRLPFAGVFALDTLREAHARRRLLLGVFWLALLWGVDALWQFASGHDFFGYPREGQRLSGVFYPKFRLALVLAAFSPLCFEVARRLDARYRGAWLLGLLLCAVIVLSGSRNAWIMLGVSVPAYLAFLIWQSDPRARLGSWLRRGILTAALVGLAVWQDPGVMNRIADTTGVFSADFEAFDRATARRLSIWKPALDATRSHWLNGVGARGFRYVYAEYAGEDNFWRQDEREGVTHPHLFLLEVAADTGIIGVAGLMLFALLLIRRVGGLPPPRRAAAVPAALGVLTAWLPLNTHLAFYGTYWSTIAWWLLFLCLGHLAAGERAPGERLRGRGAAFSLAHPRADHRGPRSGAPPRRGESARGSARDTAPPCAG